MLNFTIETKDHFLIHATLFASKGTTSSDPVVIISSATGVNQKYYKHYASFLSEHNFNVLTYDYRGIGASKPKQLKGFRGSILDWGCFDLPSVINHASAHFPHSSLVLVGHSIGGCLPGFCRESAQAKSMLNVAAQMAYYKDWSKSHRYKIYFMWHVVLPLITRIYGYLPGKRWKLEDLPYHVMMQWHARRILPSMEDQLQKAGYPSYYKNITATTLHLCLSDDPIGTPVAIERLSRLFPNSNQEIKQITPESIGASDIGHFGFFRKEYKDSLWRSSLDWLKQNT